MNQLTRCIIILSALLLSLTHDTVAGTKDLEDLNRKEKKFIRKIRKKFSFDLSYLKKLRPSIENKDDLSGFYGHQRAYMINQPFDSVWNNYTLFDFTEVWAGPVNTFKLAYVKPENQVISANTKEETRIQEGMSVFLELRITWFLKIPVSFVINNVDKENGTMEFTYTSDNITHGKQVIHFEQRNGKTFVKHTTRYHSGMKIRDKLFYEPYHEKCIDEFHLNITGEANIEVIE